MIALGNAYLFTGNRSLQMEAGQRAQYIQQSVALDGLYREIVQGLAERAVRTRDDQIRDMLAGEGINLKSDASSPAEGQP